MPVLKILTIPNDILRQKAKKIDLEKIHLKELKFLAQDMILTMQEAKGVGLAAPQVGRSIRLIVVEQTDGALALINPVIKRKSWSKELGQEGCLSVPGQYGEVKRAVSVTMEAVDLNGKKIKISAHGLFARVLQHEIDHLDGILFIDRIKKMKKEKILKM